jgi:hypothetical protein
MFAIDLALEIVSLDFQLSYLTANSIRRKCDSFSIVTNIDFEVLD